MISQLCLMQGTRCLVRLLHCNPTFPRSDLSLEDKPDRGRTRSLSPLAHAPVNATACALVSHTGQPLRRQSTADSTRRVHAVLARPMRNTTVWRTLQREAIPPWQDRA